MVGLPCLMSQCAKLHITGWMWAVFTCVCLESGTWPVVIFMMNQRKEQRVCIKFCASLGKSAIETLTMIQQAFGDQSLSCVQMFKRHARFKTGHTSVDNEEHIQRSRSCTTPETVAWIQELVRQDRRWTIHDTAEEVGMLWDMPMGSDGRIGHALRRSQICVQDPDSWPEAAVHQHLHWTSSARMKPSCPGSSLVMRARFTVTNLRQSNNPPNGKAPCCQGQERPDRWKAMLRAWSSWSSLSLMSRGLWTKNLFQQAKLWIPGSTAMFCGNCMKTSPQTLVRADLAVSPWQRPIPQFRSHPAVFGKKQNSCHPPPTILPWFDTLWLLPISKNETEAERTVVWYHWGDTGRIAESAWHSDRKGLPGSIPEMETVGPMSNMWKGTTSRVTVADRPYGEFYDFYSVGLGNSGYHLIYQWVTQD